MLKLLFTTLLFSGAIIVVAADASVSPVQVIERSGGISITDGSSYYTFSKDGSFKSGPLGMSGRSMRGRWTKDSEGRFIATARLGWVNGLSSGTEYRRIVFCISRVTERREPLESVFGTSAEIFDTYFLIDEMTEIPKPPEEVLE